MKFFFLALAVFIFSACSDDGGDGRLNVGNFGGPPGVFIEDTVSAEGSPVLQEKPTDFTCDSNNPELDSRIRTGAQWEERFVYLNYGEVVETTEYTLSRLTVLDESAFTARVEFVTKSSSTNLSFQSTFECTMKVENGSHNTFCAAPNLSMNGTINNAPTPSSFKYITMKNPAPGENSYKSGYYEFASGLRVRANSISYMTNGDLYETTTALNGNTLSEKFIAKGTQFYRTITTAEIPDFNSFFCTTTTTLVNTTEYKTLENKTLSKSHHEIINTQF